MSVAVVRKLVRQEDASPPVSFLYYGQAQPTFIIHDDSYTWKAKLYSTVQLEVMNGVMARLEQPRVVINCMPIQI